MTNVTSLTIVALPMLKFDHDYQGCGHRAWVPDPWKSNWIGPLLNFTFNLSFILSIWIVRFSLGHPENFPLLIYHNYTLRSKKLEGWVGILVSPCPSVHLWTESCPLCIFCNTRRIHFIFTHLIKQLQKVCRVGDFVFCFSKFKKLKFWQIL